MKQILFGRDGRIKGYLIQKKVVEDKLREKFGVLKDKTINCLDKGHKSCEIGYEPRPKVEKKKDYVIICEKKREIIETILLKTELLNKLFGLKGNIANICLKIVKNKKFIRNYLCQNTIREEEYLFNNKEVYYFFEIKDYETEDFCEIT